MMTTPTPTPLTTHFTVSYCQLLRHLVLLLLLGLRHGLLVLLLRRSLLLVLLLRRSLGLHRSRLLHPVLLRLRLTTHLGLSHGLLHRLLVPAHRSSAHGASHL